MMDDRDYFTVETTSLTLPKRGSLAIFAGDRPRKNADGTTSYSMRAPMLLMPPEMWRNDRELLGRVATLLNDSAHLFFDSAPKPDAPHLALALAAALERERALVAALQRRGQYFCERCEEIVWGGDHTCPLTASGAATGERRA